MVSPDPITEIARLENTQLHRDTYIAVLNSVLRTNTERWQFANAVGITPRYLNGLLNPFGSQAPSRELAYRIAEVITLPTESKQDLLHHLRSANPYSIEALHNPDVSTERLTPEQARDVILIIGNYEHRAMHTTDTDIVRNTYNILLKLGTWALARLDPSEQPQHYVGICSSLNGTAGILNMPVKSLWFAQSALTVVQNNAFWNTEELQQAYADFVVNSWDGAAMAWHNLGEPHKALACVKQAKNFALNLPTVEERNRVVPMVIMEELNTYTIHPNFSIRAAEHARDQGLNSLYGSVDRRSSLGLVASLIERNMVESYVQHGTPRSLRKAERYVDEHFDEQRLSQYGPLIHTMHLRTRAKLHQKTRNHVAYTEILQQAYQLSTEAGLIHQQAEIHQELQDLQSH